MSTSKSVISATSRSKSTVTLIPGDGIGPEIATAVERIFEAAEAPIAWERVDVTPVRYPDGTMGIPKAVIDSVNRNKVGLKSPLMTPGIERQKFILLQYNINGPNHIERSKCMDKKF